MKYLVILLAFTGLLANGFAESLDTASPEIYWKEASFPSHAGTKAIIFVVDNSMNLHSNSIDYVWVEIFSDSDPIGFRMPLFETDLDSGIFKGTVVFTNDPPSGRGFIYTVEGDTLTAKYAIKNLQHKVETESTNGTNNDSSSDLFATAIVGGSSPPLERVPASDFRLLDRNDNLITNNSIGVDQQVRLTSDLKNQQENLQSFAYLVLIENSKNQAESLSWITGNLTSSQQLTAESTWIPFEQGTYTATVFVWESIDNPTALSPPLSMELVVK